MLMSFVHLHVHSAYSLRESIFRLEDLVEDAVAYGMPAVALTDTNAMYGAIAFYNHARRAGVQPILGAQLNVRWSDVGVERANASGIRKGDRLDTSLLDAVTLLAKNEDGYKALSQLVTLAQTRLHTPYVTLDELASLSTDCVGLVGGGESRLMRDASSTSVDHLALSMTRYLNALPQGQLFLDVQDHQVPHERAGLPSLIRLARDLNIPLVATNDVHYRRKNDAPLHRAFAGLEHPNASEKWPEDTYHFALPSEMQKKFANLPEAVENTLTIAQMCRSDLSLHQVRMPKYPTKDGRSAEIVLREAARAGAVQRYGSLSNDVEARLNYELQVICDMGFADYFLVVADFIRYAHQHGISTGPGRGSAAGSLVAYALRITDVDPVANQLLFERFLNPARVSLPDIDTDFEYERRNEVIQYVVSKYGAEYVAQIGTFGTLAARAAIRDAGRMIGADNRLVDRMAKMIPGTPGMTLDRAREEVRGFADLTGTDAQAKRIYETAHSIEGLPHHTSVHAAGVVISPTVLNHSVPLQPGADGIPVTQYPMADIESLGLVKMDFLGLRTLTLMDECIRSVESRTDRKLDWRRITDTDKATYEMLTRAETNGVFQLESTGIKRVLRQLKPTNLDDIVAVISLYRPGPMENIPVFIDAKHGRKPIHYPHADLEPILKDTYGVIVYQEQIMQIASRMAGFSLGEADLLRRAVSKKKREVLDAERIRFVNGCLGKGYDETTSNDVYDLIVRFADYGFNRSHAAAYAVLAFRTAYLRAHYLPDFLAASMTMSMGSAEKIKQYMQDAKRNRIRVRAPSVLKSTRGFSVDDAGDIRTGLLAIRNVGEGAVEAILTAREEADFQSLSDFLVRVNQRIVNRRALDSLLEAGAFDEFFPDNATTHAKVQMLEEATSVAEEHRQFAGLGLLLENAGENSGIHGLNGPRPDSSSPTGQLQSEVQDENVVLYIRYHSRREGQAQLKAVQQVLASSPGQVPVALYDVATRKTRLLGEKWKVSVSPELITILDDIVGIGNVKVSRRRS